MDSNITLSGESFLIKQFHGFYDEVIRLRRMVETDTWVFSQDSAAEGEDEQAPAINTVWQHLLSLLERQALSAGQHG
ncbi:MAG: hypothetical protein OEU26_29435, partial [Candidatus Tectomicrobia bacterium]|nr:hypothetical protein [Candidatus Tectomicrobia bacterium]